MSFEYIHVLFTFVSLPSVVPGIGQKLNKYNEYIKHYFLCPLPNVIPYLEKIAQKNQFLKDKEIA